VAEREILSGCGTVPPEAQDTAINAANITVSSAAALMAAVKPPVLVFFIKDPP
jgi:hypothetical protein